MRKIVVDGRTYEWTVLQEQVRIRNDNRENFRIPFPPGYGRPYRQHWDDGSSAPITPGMVANMIRVHEGRAPVEPKPPARRKDTLVGPLVECQKAPPGVTGYVFVIKRVFYDDDSGQDRSYVIEIHADPAVAKERVSLLNGDKTLAAMLDLRKRLDDWVEKENLAYHRRELSENPHPYPTRERKHGFLKDMGVKDAEVRNAILRDDSPRHGPRYITEEMPIYGA